MSSRPPRTTKPPSYKDKGKTKATSSRRSQPPPVEYVTSSDSDDIDQGTRISYQYAPKDATVAQLHDNHEKDFRPIFESSIGRFIYELVTAKGWEKLLGDETWYVNLDYVNWFRKHLVGTHPSRTYLQWKSEDGRVHQRTIDPEYLSQFTGIEAVESPSWEFFDDFDSPLTTIRANAIAPYHIPSQHYDGDQHVLKVKGMQANIMALTKWMALNVVGTYTTHAIHGRVGWMIDCLLHNSFPEDFDIHCVMIIALRSHMNSGKQRVACPLPALATRIAAKCLRLDPIATVPKPKGQRMTVSYCSDISGLWEGSIIPLDHANRPQVEIGGDGANVKYLFEKSKKRKGDQPATSTMDLDHSPHPSPTHQNHPQPTFIPPSTTHSFQVGGSSTPAYSEPFRNTVPFDAYGMPDLISNYQIQEQNTMIWNQQALVVQGLTQLLTHLAVPTPAYTGFAAPGFPSYVPPPAENAHDDDGSTDPVDEDA